MTRAYICTRIGQHGKHTMMRNVSTLRDGSPAPRHSVCPAATLQVFDALSTSCGLSSTSCVTVSPACAAQQTPRLDFAHASRFREAEVSTSCGVSCTSCVSRRAPLRNTVSFGQFETTNNNKSGVLVQYYNQSALVQDTRIHKVQNTIKVCTRVRKSWQLKLQGMAEQQPFPLRLSGCRM